MIISKQHGLSFNSKVEFKANDIKQTNGHCYNQEKIKSSIWNQFRLEEML